MIGLPGAISLPSMRPAGIGFSKMLEGNLELMAGLRRFRQALLPPLQNMPILAGPSRKRFLGNIIGKLQARRTAGLLPGSSPLLQEVDLWTRSFLDRQHLLTSLHV